MQRCSHQSAYASDQARVLNSPRRVQQFWRGRTYLLVFQWLDKVLNPIALSRFNVVIQENQPIAARCARTSVAFCGKIERAIEGDESNVLANRFSSCAKLLD